MNDQRVTPGAPKTVHQRVNDNGVQEIFAKFDSESGTAVTTYSCPVGSEKFTLRCSQSPLLLNKMLTLFNQIYF